MLQVNVVTTSGSVLHSICNDVKEARTLRDALVTEIFDSKDCVRLYPSRGHELTLFCKNIVGVKIVTLSPLAPASNEKSDALEL